ncbi:MAG: response regulator [Myxococcales bacterium]|nr:response regulator [Myxococcales bacterium]
MEIALAGKGADVVGVADAGSAIAALGQQDFSILLSDLHLPEQDGFSLITAVRKNPRTTAMPAIAITGRAEESTRLAALAAGFSKVIAKPLDPFALIPSITSLVAISSAANELSIETMLARGDVRGALAKLNAGTPYRFTSVLRFDGDKLSSVWSFDRESPTTDSFPLELPIAASYCLFIKDTGQPFMVTDASADPRTASHAKRGVLDAYCGVPIVARDGSLFGSLCHYDESPQQPTESMEQELERVAAMLFPVMNAKMP